MENNSDFIPKIETVTENKYEARFKKLAENTSGQVIKIENLLIKDTIPYLITYPENKHTNEETVRVYRGINNIPVKEASQLPTILRDAKVIDQELIDLSAKLGNNPSEENFKKIIQKNNLLGNETSNRYIGKARQFIADTMVEYNNDDYQDVFKIMHYLENTASPYVAATSEIDKSLSYAMFDAPGMVIIADIPKSLVKPDFSDSHDKEVVVNGPIRPEYIKSLLLVSARHSIEDQDFIQSVKSLVSSDN